MEKLQVKGVEVTFDDLTVEVQRSLYLKDREKFQFDAAKSEHYSIRKLVVSEETTTFEALDEVFKAELEIWQNVDIIECIWWHKNFKKTDDKRQALAESKNVYIRLIVAKCIDYSSDFLNEMLRNEVQNEDYQRNKVVVEAILSNPKFQMEQETLEILSKCDWWIARLMAARSEDATSKFLNEMLRNEVQNEEYQDGDVVEAILSNSKFQMEEKTLNVLKEHKYNDYRILVAEYKESSSEFLNEMLRNEVQNEEYQEDPIVDAILANPQFQMEQETLYVLVKSEKWKYRIIAAESKEKIGRAHV